jgi:DNA-directed RNA polymerase specialized sigma24 family protein
VHDTLPYADDFDLAQRCLEGQESALVELQTTYRPVVVGYLRKNGATEGEAMEIAESRWADLINQRPGRRPRLATYGGMSALATWLYPLAVNRLMARRRREEVERKYVEKGGDIADLPAASEDEGCEPFLIQLMKEAIEAGFRACSSEDFVKLQLHHSDQLYYIELGKMFHRGTASIQRDVIDAADVVREATLKYIKDRDSYLQLTWEDFQTLCRVANPACFGTDVE